MTRFEYHFLLGLLWWLKQGLCVCQLPCSGLLEKKYKRHCMLSKIYTELHLGQLASCFQDLLVWPTRSFHGLSICLVLVVFTLLTSSLLLKKALHLLSSRRRWSWLTNGLSSYTNSHTVAFTGKACRESQIFSQVPWWRCRDYWALTLKHKKLFGSIDWDVMICIDWEVQKLSGWIFSAGCVER